MPVEIVVLELGTMQEVLRRQRVIELRDQLQQLGVVFGIRDCLFPVPGYYEVSMYANGQLIGSRRIRLRERS
jgi:hypothetical protein